MAFTYDPTDLDKTTQEGRLNVVRLLVGDTDSTDVLLDDSAIYYSLVEKNDDTYLAASLCAKLISAKFSRDVDTEHEGVLRADASTRAKQYADLAVSLEALGRGATASLGISAGGISKSAMAAAAALPDRVNGAFTVGMFDDQTNV